MTTNPDSGNQPQINQLLDRLRELPDAGLKMLQLSIALTERGHYKESAQVENAALELDDPDVIHEWRMMQARRAPANQFLLLRNESRTSAYKRALFEQVSPGDLVLEIGTGSGILAMLAAQAGADRVVTCERQAFMAQVAKNIVSDNGLEHKIHVLSKSAHELKIGTDLPRRADLLIADLFTGNLLAAGGLNLIKDAKTKLLHRESKVIPSGAAIRGRLVGGADLEKLCRVGESRRFDLSRFNLFSPPVVHLSPERFSTLNYQGYSKTLDCFDFDFTNLCGFEPRSKEVEIECTSSGGVIGFLEWLRIDFSTDNSMESHENSNLNWTRYLHTFPQTVNVASGQRLTLHFEHDWTSFAVWPK